MEVLLQMGFVKESFKYVKMVDGGKLWCKRVTQLRGYYQKVWYTAHFVKGGEIRVNREFETVDKMVEWIEKTW